MNILDVVLLQYPGIEGVSYWETQYDGSPWEHPIEGLVWENKEHPKPTKTDLEKWENDYSAKIVFNDNKIKNQPIYEQLNAVDLRSIRALRENDFQRLDELEQEAVLLRSQLLPTE